MDYQVYFIPTPIGNLEDITLRALKTLKEVDLIACEDTRESMKLLNHYDIKKDLISYHKFNEKSRSEDLIRLINEGKNIGVISDQGMPGLSDPGLVLVRELIKKDISYTVLPGPSSILTALVGSGQDSDEFAFYGFIGKKNKDKKDLYKRLEAEDKTSIIFESVHNIENTLLDFKKLFPNRKITIARELTKKFESYHTEILRDLDIDNITLKGEFVLVLERAQKKAAGLEDYKDEIGSMLKEGIQTKKIVKEIRKKSDLPKNEIYDYVLFLKN